MISARKELLADDVVGRTRGGMPEAYWRTQILLQAPRPGSVVIVHSRLRDLGSNLLKPMLLSAMDVRTHLQLARLYVTTGIASELDFVEFVLRVFPFSVKEFSTSLHFSSANPSENKTDGRFTRFLHARNIRHRLSDDSRGSLSRYCSSYFFSADLPDCVRENSINSYLRELRNHLFLHNNHHPFRCLEGRTAVQTLRMFSSRISFDDFDPFAR